MAFFVFSSLPFSESAPIYTLKFTDSSLIIHLHTLNLNDLSNSDQTVPSSTLLTLLRLTNVKMYVWCSHLQGQWLLCAVLSHSAVSESFWPHGLLCPARLLCPWEFSRQEYWSGLPCALPGDLPNPEIEPKFPALQVNSLPAELPGKPKPMTNTDSFSEFFGFKSVVSKWEFNF